ncbi:MAG TPA: amidohydrolase family protein [Acidimicrobiales bacterium]|nr:amidohydrolase family protein [Acidimicrobiales bacterium]
MSEVAWVVDASIVEVESGSVRSGRTLRIAAGRIEAAGSAVPRAGERVLDAHGGFVVPGLISCHTHLSIVFPMGDTDPAEFPALTAVRATARARAALESGITTLRCVHEQHRVDLWLREARRRGWLELPRIFGAGRAVTTPGGHGAGMGCAEASGEDEFYEAACEELRAGADHVKIFINGGIARAGEDPGASEMTDGELDGAVRAAGEHDAYVVAHSGSSTAIRQALARGVRCFEHAYELDSETAALLAREGAYVTPTLVVTRCEPWMRDNHFAEATIANAARAAEGHLASIKNAVAAGVPLLAGTDLPPADDVGGLSATVYELTLLEDAGLSRVEALQSATSTPASLLGVTGELGTLRPGARADLLVLEANPLDDLTALGAPRTVVQEGRVVAGRVP